MTDEGGGNAGRLEQWDLEGDDREQAIEGARQGLGSAGPGRPRLGRHELHQLQIGRRRPEPPGQEVAEAPRVDQHGDVRLLADRQFGKLTGAAIGPAVGQEALQHAHDREFGDVESALEALGRHGRPADTDEAGLRAQASLELGHQFRAEHVP